MKRRPKFAKMLSLPDIIKLSCRIRNIGGCLKGKRSFTVVIEKDKDGWLVADVPELQACHTQAKTMDELLKRVKEVIELCLEEEGEVPQTSFVGVQVVEV